MKGIFWNCNGFADGKKYRFLSDLTKDKSLDFIALRKRVEPVFHKILLTPFVLVEILFGTVWLHMADPVA